MEIFLKRNTVISSTLSGVANTRVIVSMVEGLALIGSNKAEKYDQKRHGKLVKKVATTGKNAKKIK